MFDNPPIQNLSDNNPYLPDKSSFCSPKIKFPSHSPALHRFIQHFKKKPTKLELELIAVQNNLSASKPIGPILIKAFESKEYDRLRNRLANILNGLPADELILLMNEISLKRIENEHTFVHQKCLDLLSHDKIEEIAKVVSNEFLNAKQTAGRLCKLLHYVEKYQTDPARHPLKEEYRKQSPVLISFFSNFIDSIMSTFNLLDVKRSPGTYFESKSMLDIYWRFLTIPLLILQALQMYFMSYLKAFGVFAVASLVASAALYVYFRWLQPCPDDLPYCQNMTIEALKGNLAPVYSRDAEVKNLINDLCANTGESRKHPILIGKSGVGKTELISALAQYLVKGKDVPAELKGRKVFSLNTSDLIPLPGGFEIKSPLDRLIDAVGSHADNIILFMDEFQSAVTPSLKKNKLGKQLLTRLHKSPGSIPFLIAATTEEEFVNHIRNTPLKRRFKATYISEMTEKQTLSILRAFAQHEAPEIQIEDSVLKFAYDASHKLNPEEPQPGKAKHLLALAIAQTKIDPAGCQKLKELLQIKQEEYDELASCLSREKVTGPFIDSKVQNGYFKNLIDIKDVMKSIQKQIKIKEKGLEEYRKFKTQHASQEKAVHEMSRQILEKTKSAQKIPESLSKLFIFYVYFLLPALDKKINGIVSDHSLNVKVEKEMISK